ncbi:MAG: hypothetical protein NTV81_01780 [Candidatus Komeilibacteria bacterium]|nr:hypothetical protein [Candidatus Komeilibacteria bacterium]
MQRLILPLITAAVLLILMQNNAGIWAYIIVLFLMMFTWSSMSDK